MRKELLNSVRMVAIKIIAAVLSYLVIVLLARWLSPEYYGVYSVLMSSTILLATISQFGFPMTIVKYLSHYIVQNEGAYITSVISYMRRFSTYLILVIIVISGLLSISLYYLQKIDDLQLLVYFLTLLLILPSFTLIDLNNGIARTFDKIYLAILPKDIIWRTFIIIGGFILFQVFRNDPKTMFIAIIATMGISLTLIYIFQTVLVNKVLPKGYQKRVSNSKEWKKTSFYIWIVNVSRVSYRSLDVLIVSIFVDIKSAGFYFIAARTAELIGFMLASLNLIIGPNIAKHNSMKKLTEVQPFLAYIALFLATSSALLFFIFALFGDDIILLLAGEEYHQVYLPLIILAAGQLINSLTGSVGVVLNMTGNEKANMFVQLTTLPVTLAMILVGTFLYDITGAAVASCLGIIIWNVRLWFAVKKRVSIDPSIVGAIQFLWKKYV